MRALAARVRLALLTRPSLRDWFEFAAAAMIVLALYATVGFATGLIHYEPRPLFQIASIAAAALIVPCFTEELFFRGLLVPGRNESAPPPRSMTSTTWMTWILASTALFAAWHVVETFFLPHSASLFRRLDFLALAALLGLACAILRWRSGSLWPAIALHWLVVVLWQGWLGGPSVLELANAG